MYVTVYLFNEINEKDSPLKHDSVSCKGQCKGTYLKKREKVYKQNICVYWLQILIGNMPCMCLGGSSLPDYVG